MPLIKNDGQAVAGEHCPLQFCGSIQPAQPVRQIHDQQRNDGSDAHQDGDEKKGGDWWTKNEIEQGKGDFQCQQDCYDKT
jgi:hypothetical protein